ncbi:Neurotrypsin, partial [Chlamydotis macqueenii]
VRIQGGKNEFEGTVEVYLNGIWGTICGSHWDNNDATVICRQLALGEKGTAKHIPFSGLGLIPVYWSEVRCRGDEENILLCEKDIWQDGTCPQKMAAAVTCLSSLGKEKYICKNLPLHTFPTLYTEHEVTWCGTAPWVIWVSCPSCVPQPPVPPAPAPIPAQGRQNLFKLGDKLKDQSKRNTPVFTPIRLAGGNKAHEGRVEVYHAGQWGTVCDDQWDDADAEVVCRQLGLGGVAKAWSQAYFGEGSGPVLLDEVRCTGNELSIEQCPKSSWREHNCGHKEDAGVSCTPLTDGALRLTSGKGGHEGRLEVYHTGQWGTICDDGWTELNTQVVCRQLGFKYGKSTSESHSEGSSGPIWLDDVSCSGKETNLLQCSRREWGKHDCNHQEDVRLICHPDNDSHKLSLVFQNNTSFQQKMKTVYLTFPTIFLIGKWTKTLLLPFTSQHLKKNPVSSLNLFSGPPIRLMDGENKKEGRVEIFINGQWGTICDDGWSDKDAAVVCRQLGYKGPARARTMAYFGEGKGPIHVDNVKCTGNERSLADCIKQDIGKHNCRHSEDAGVIC